MSNYFKIYLYTNFLIHPCLWFYCTAHNFLIKHSQNVQTNGDPAGITQTCLTMLIIIHVHKLLTLLHP